MAIILSYPGRSNLIARALKNGELSQAEGKLKILVSRRGGREKCGQCDKEYRRFSC